MLQGECSVAGCKDKATTFAIVRSQTGQISEGTFCKAHTQRLGDGYVLPNPAAFAPNSESPTYVECGIRAVFFVYDEVLFNIVLRGIDGNSALVVRVGYPEACSIYQAMKDGPSPSPRTHELIGTLVEALGGSLIEAIVEGFDYQTQAYKCHLAVRRRDSVVNVACRGSDAVALSLYAKLPIRVNNSLMGQALGSDANLLD